MSQSIRGFNTVSKPDTFEYVSTTINPKSFKGIKSKFVAPKFLNKYINNIRDYEAQATFKAEYNPEVLEVFKGKLRTLNASNFDAPYGSIAIPAKLNEPISTSGLLQCAGLAIVDRKHNLQTLVHCCPTACGNNEMFKYLFSHSNPKDLELTIVPGFYKTTDTTIDLIMGLIDKYANGSKVNFANFPNKDIDVLLLQDGILKCCTRKNILPNTNPIDRIVHG